MEPETNSTPPQIDDNDARTASRPSQTAQPAQRLILRSVTSGLLRARSLPRLAIVQLVMNFVFALVLTLPFHRMLDDSLGYSLSGEQSMKVPDLNWLMAFLQSDRGFIDTLNMTALWLGFLYMVLNMLVSAGMLEVLSADFHFTLRRFFGGIISYGLQFLRLWALSLIVYFIIFLVFNKLVGSGLEWWTRDWASEGGVFALFLLKNAVLVATLLLAIMVFDYAKIRIVMERSGSVLAESLWALRFVKNYLWLTLGVFCTLGLGSAVLVILYLGIDALLSPRSLWLVIVAFLVQQVFMFYRMWLRVALYGAEISLYKKRAR
jgi:hypothetical protein